MKPEEYIQKFSDLRFIDGKYTYPNYSNSTPSRAAFVIKIHRLALTMTEYSKLTPRRILIDEPFKSLLGADSEIEAIDVLTKALLEVRARLLAKKTPGSRVFLAQVEPVFNYVYSIPLFDKVNLASKFSTVDDKFLAGLYAADNSDFKWNNNAQSCDKIEEMRIISKELFDKVKNSSIDSDLQVLSVIPVFGFFFART